MGTPSVPPQQPQIVMPGTGWVDVASRVVVQVGFPVVVAAWLLWYVLGRFQTNIDLITVRLSSNAEVAGKLVEAEVNAIAELKGQSIELRAQTELMKQFLDLRQRELRGGPPP